MKIISVTIIFFLFFISISGVVSATDNSQNPTEESLWSYNIGPGLTSVGMSQDGSIVVASQYQSPTSLIYYFKHGTPLWKYKINAGVNSVAVSSDGGSVVAGASDKKVYLFNRDGKLIWNYLSTDAVSSVSISSNSEQIVASSNNKIYSFNNAGQVIWTYNAKENLLSIAISSDGSKIIAGSYINDAYLLTGTGKYVLTYHITDSSIRSVAISGDGNNIIIGAITGNNHLYNYNPNGNLIWSYKSKAIGFPATAISSDGSIVVAGTSEGSIDLFNKAGTLLGENSEWRDVKSLALSSDGKYTAIGSQSGSNLGDIKFIKSSSLIPPVENPLIVIVPFVANFTANPTSGPADLTVQFNDTTNGKPYWWSWSFGDCISCSGLTGTEYQNPTHTYYNPGTYTVRMQALGQDENNPGHQIYSEWVTQNITVLPRVVPTATVLQTSTSGTNPWLFGTIFSILILGIIAVFGINYVNTRKKHQGIQNVSIQKPPRTADPKKTELSISLDRTKFDAGKWHKLRITLSNPSPSHVNNVHFTFSDEFDTKGIKPISVKAGQSSYIDISILPKTEGNVLLDVTLMYNDSAGKHYEKSQEFWIEVIKKGPIILSSSDTPTTPVGGFTPKPVTPKSLPPELSDRFTEGVLIGKGGFARVFKAKRRDGIPVAIKIPITLDASTGKSFIAEMQNWTKFSHPNIVKVYDFNIMPVAYFEMELCDSSFADLKKPVNPVEAAWLLFNVCDGLKYAHAKAIIHRDLKPQNILLKDGVPKISDWGLSKVVAESTTTTATAFTPFYAAPEQLTHKKKDERTDVWQLGVILYELVTGVLPFNGDNMVEIMSSIATTDPKKPGDVVTDARKIEPVIMMCLQKDPNRRFQSVTALQTALARYLNVDYAQALKLSVTTKDFRKSALFCGDLVLVNLKIGDIRTAHKYLTDFVYYTEGDIKFEAHELAKQIQHRMELNLTEIPDELIQKAEFIVHKVNFGF